MADTDELKQMLGDLGEQSRQQHAEAMGRMDEMGTRIEANEQETKGLKEATRAHIQYTDERFRLVEGQIEGVMRQLAHPSQPAQLGAGSTDGEKKASLSEFADGFWQVMSLGTHKKKGK